MEFRLDHKLYEVQPYSTPASLAVPSVKLEWRLA